MNDLKTICEVVNECLIIEDSLNNMLAKILINTIKAESTTYGELDVFLNKTRQQLVYKLTNPEKIHLLDCLLGRIQELLKEEKNNLLIVNSENKER